MEHVHRTMIFFFITLSLLLICVQSDMTLDVLSEKSDILDRNSSLDYASVTSGYDDVGTPTPTESSITFLENKSEELGTNPTYSSNEPINEHYSTTFKTTENTTVEIPIPLTDCNTNNHTETGDYYIANDCYSEKLKIEKKIIKKEISDIQNDDPTLKEVIINSLDREKAEEIFDNMLREYNKDVEEDPNEETVHIKQSSLVFVFDATNSMYDDLVQLQEGAALILDTMLKREEKPIKNYVLVTYRDPYIGDSIVTSDHREFKDVLGRIIPSLGGDCPESALTGIKVALNLSLPHSYVYVFTDASAKDYEMEKEVINLVQEKQSQIVFILTGYCRNKDTPNYKVYEKLAAVSGGQIFHLEKSDVKKVLAYVEDSLDSNRVHLSSIIYPPGDHSHQLSVDDTLKKVTVSVAGSNPKVSLTNPTGELVDGPPQALAIVNLPDIQVINLINPEPGNWTINVESPEQHSVRLTGLSNITFTHGFSVKDPATMDHTSLRPLNGTQNYLMISVDGDLKLENVTSAELVNVTGEIIFEIPLIGVKNNQHKLLFKTAPILPPVDSFNIAINGFDKNGFPFRRISSTGVIAQEPDKPVVKVKSKVTGEYHDQIVLLCKVQSLVEVDVWWFKDGHPLMPKQKHPQSGVTEYTIVDLTEATQGTYVCKATNRAGVAVAQTNVVIVGSPPKVVFAPEYGEYDSGIEIKLHCSVDSKLPASTYISFKRMDSIETINMDSVIEAIQDRITLYSYTFILSKETQGTYYCNSTNKAGSIQKESIITLTKPISVMVMPEVVVFSKGHSLRFSCIISETTNGKWIQHSNEILDTFQDSSLSWHISQVPIEEKNGIQLFLDIINPDRRHEGFYDCFAYRGNQTVYSTVEAKYVEGPSINMKHTSLLFELDSTAEIDCEAFGIPEPFISWYGLDGNQIVPEEGIMRRVDVNELNQLVIHNINSIDNGKYTCKAENQHGIVEKDIEITVFQKPFFIEFPEDKAIGIYTSSVLRCEAEGIPKPNVTWYFNDVPCTDIELLAESGVNLLLTNADLKHNGKYSCIAENEYDIIKKTVDIKIVGLEPPMVDKGSKIVKLNEGDSYKFVCRFIHGKPYPTLSWEKNGEPIWDMYSQNDLNGGSSAMVLTVDNISVQQEGNYSCIARNIQGEDRYTFSLEIHSPPKFTSKQDDNNSSDAVDLEINQISVEAVVGEKMTLNCDPSGKPKPLVTWSKNGSPVVYTNMLFRDENDNLVKTKVSEMDEGLYTCTASNPAGERSRNFTVNVLVRPTVLNESSVEPVVQIIEGQLVMLPCPIHAIPTPEITWTYDNVSITPSNRMHVDTENTLRFVANITDAGLYRCVASNKAGNTSKEYLVIIFVPPYFEPSGNEAIKIKENTSIVLECNAFGYPLPTIRWFKSGNILDNTSDNYVFDDSGKLTITNSSKNTTGAYSCVAENSAGLSEKIFHIILNEAPSILASEVPMDIQLIAGEEYNVPCKATGNPTPYITWLKDGKPFINDIHTRVQTDGTLLLRIVTENQNGKYTCQAANSEGSIEVDYNVQVVAPPVLLESEEQIKSIIVEEGSSVTLECPLKPTHIIPTIQWYKNSEVIEQNETSSKLTLVNVTRNDASEFSCLASNVGGRTSAIFKVVVHWAPVFTANVTDQEEHLELLEGDPIKLLCHVDANPAADVQWLRNLEVIGDVSPVFKKSYVKIHHAGEHVCVASNPLGQIKKKFLVDVSVPPTIEGAEKMNIEVRVGQSVRLDCYANGYPKPHIEWMSNNSSDWDVIGDGRILKTFNIATHSEGLYSCKATNKVGKAEKIFNITVHEPPKVPTVLIDNLQLNSSVISLESGFNLSMSCISSGRPPSTILWIKNGVILNKDLMTVNKSELNLTNVDMQDSGKYTCLTKNDVGSEEYDFTLDVFVVPEILDDSSDGSFTININGMKQKWKKIETFELQTIKLRCPAFGNPYPDIYWFKDNSYMNYSNLIAKDHGQLLILENITRNQKGNYTCVAKNKVGEDKMNFIVDVWVSPSVEYQKDGMNTHVVKKGENIHLECAIASNPPSNIRWLKGAYTEVFDGDKNHIRDNNTTLIINDVNVTDNGNYSCIATNIAGMVEVVFSVEVVDAPVFIESEDTKKPNAYPNGTVITKIRRSFQLTCNAHSHPDPVIEWYKDGVWLLKTFTGSSLHISTDGKYLTVMDAKLNNTGKYTCIAYNKYGSIEKEFDVKVLVPAEWSSWSPWSECSESCGPGLSTRTRECHFQGDIQPLGGLPYRAHNDNDQQTGGIKISDEFLDKSICKGNSSEHKPCSIMPCMINGGWSNWGNWTSCSAMCGPGTRRRYRTCSSPKPQYGGTHCAGAEVQHEPCMGDSCSQWLSWSPWSKCSVTCGSGVQSRIRICDGPSQSCLGPSRDYMTCRMLDCSGKWGRWSDWSPCSVTCGNGVRRRYRECLSTGCIGGNLQAETCKYPPCDKLNKYPQLLYSHDKSSGWGKSSETNLKNGKPYVKHLNEKEGYLPSASFVISPESVNDRTNNKKTTSVPVNNLRNLNSGYDSDNDMDIQPSTGDDKLYQRNNPKLESEDINVDVIIDGNYTNMGGDNEESNVISQTQKIGPPPLPSISTCSIGFIYDEDLLTCVDINECQYIQNGCHSTQLCENLPGSYRCFCQRGYLSMGPGQRCIDINECLQNTHECSNECINTAGSYKCACPVGLKLASDNKTCVHDVSHYYSLRSSLYTATTTSKPISVYLPEDEDDSSMDETVLLTRISPKRGKPQRRRRPHKHTFENDYEDYDVYKNSRKESLSPINDEEYADTNVGIGRQRISKHTRWDTITEIPNDDDTDIYIPHDTTPVASVFNVNVSKTTPVKLNSKKRNKKVTVISKLNENKDSQLSEDDSYEDEDTNIHEDNCPYGQYYDEGNCIDIDECEMEMHSCNGVTDMCINTKGSHMCLPTPCPDKYKLNAEGVCEMNCSERDVICKEGAAISQRVIYLVVSTTAHETKLPGAILCLRYGGIANHTMYALERQPKGETFFVTTEDKVGTIHTLMTPTFMQVNRIIVSGKTNDENEEKLLHYMKFVIYLYISE